MIYVIRGNKSRRLEISVTRWKFFKTFYIKFSELKIEDLHAFEISIEKHKLDYKNAFFIFNKSPRNSKFNILTGWVPQVTRICCHKNCLERTSGGSCEFIVSMVSKKFLCLVNLSCRVDARETYLGRATFRITCDGERGWSIGRFVLHRKRSLLSYQELLSPLLLSQPFATFFAPEAIKNVKMPSPPLLPLSTLWWPHLIAPISHLARHLALSSLSHRPSGWLV